MINRPPALPIEEWSHESRAIQKVEEEVNAILENLIEVHFSDTAPRPEQFIHPDGYEEAYEEWFDSLQSKLRELLITCMTGKPPSS